MIFETLSNTNPMLIFGMATKVNGVNITVPKGEYSPDFCYCMYECDEPIQVWGGGTGWQNDKTTFLFKRQILSDTGIFTIHKDGVQVATITDSSYGVWKSSYTDDNLQYSFIIDWNLVFNAFGHGEYVIKNNYTSIGISQEFVSSTYLLSQFNDEYADGYVKFSWTQTGEISSSNFTFTEGIDFSHKIKGWFVRDKPETIKDSYQTSYRTSRQFRTEQKRQYSFRSKIAKSSDYKMVNENLALADFVSIVDFNLYGTNIRDEDFDFVEISDMNDFLENRDIVMSIGFTDYEQNIIKTNC